MEASVPSSLKETLDINEERESDSNWSDINSDDDREDEFEKSLRIDLKDEEDTEMANLNKSATSR